MPSTHTDPHHARRWLVLAVIGIAQLMVVLDATVVNIALPSAQASLGFSDDARQWVVTAYALSFGSLLLLGGRLGDLVGRKRIFIAGLIGFAVASAIGGAAQSFGMLVAARALQGVFGALLAPAALGLLTTTFTDPAERGKAFGVFGAIAGSGAAVGLLLGGVLTEYLDWRWALYVNLVFAVPAAVAAAALLHGERPTARPRLDIPGTITASAGLFGLVYGFSHAETTSWGDPVTVAMLVGGVALLGLFVALQRRVAHPLLPLRVVLDRDRGGSYVSVAIAGAGIFGVFLFLSYFLQQSLQLTPVQSGLAFLPMTAAIMVTATLTSAKVLPRVGARPLVPTGMALAAVAMAFLTRLTPDSTYAADVLPSLVLAGIAFGLIFAPSMANATLGVDAADAGVASAMVNTGQQIGGSLGTALLSTIATSAATSFATTNAAQAGGRPTPQLLEAASVHGYTTAFWWSAGIFAVGAVVTSLMLRSGVRAADPAAEPVLAH